MGGELHHFSILTPEERAAAMRKMAAAGWSDYGIAAATRQSVEAVRRVLAEGRALQEHRA